MAMRNPYQQYKQQSVMTANPGELVLMLYNGAIKFIKLGMQAIEDNNIQDAHNYIVRSENIILELMAGLDPNQEISNNMMTLYEYMHHRLMEANISKDNKILEEVLGLVRDMRDTWGEVMKISKQQNQSGQES